MGTIFITGASRGIGKAVAQRFLNAGDFVIGTSTSGSLDYSHNNLVALALDLSDRESITSCIKEFKKLDKKIDILINNAGVLKDMDEFKVDINKLRKTLEVNLFGHIQLTEALIPSINRGGHIINISSSAGSLANTTHTNYPSYKISKAALNMYTRTLAIRLADNLTVSSVHPGWVETDMGGKGADYTPEQAADDIFAFAHKEVESGQFWFKGEKFPW